VLERLGFPVDFPAADVCGQPAFNSGYREEARQSRAIFSMSFAAPNTSWSRRVRARR
jgi:L-lactate dehydrogenase complex protein LldE